jgi:hypothetical protein
MLKEKWDGDVPLREPIPRSAAANSETANQERHSKKRKSLIDILSFHLPCLRILI